MSAWVGDVSTTVEYSSDKWFMDRVPWAMWLCVAGLAVVIHAGGGRGKSAALAFVYLALLGLAFAGYAVMERLDRSSIPFYVTLPVFIVLAIAIEFVIAFTTGSHGRSGTRDIGANFWTGMINPPVNVGGWLVAYLGAGWIGYSIYRHFYPERPTLVLSPAGVGLYQAWLKDVFIPWGEIKATSDPQGVGLLANKYAAVVAVTRDFYSRAIKPKVRFFAPPGAGGMFNANGDDVLVTLVMSERRGEMDEMQSAVAARWTAFHKLVAQPASGGDTVVQGRWSWTGSAWQTGMFAAPVVALLIVVVHADL